MKKTYRNLLSLMVGGLILATSSPAFAQGPFTGYDNAFRFTLGQYQLEGESSYWDNTFADFTGDIDAFEDWSGGIEYSRDLRGPLRLIAGGFLYEGMADQSYRGFVDSFDNPIAHETTLDIAAANFGLAFTLAPRRAPVIPYVGAGVGLYAWSLEERGEFIDFFVDPPEIFPATFEDDGVAAGWFFVAGLDVPVTEDIALFAQGRWHRAEDELEGDFEDLGDLDLSGRELSIGLSWRF